jgi:hypothetical protein
MNDLDLPYFPDIELTSFGSKYDYQQRYMAVVYWIAYGNIKRVSELLSIPQDTLYGWTKKDWWEQIAKRLKAEKSEQFNAGFGRLIEKSIEVMENQLENQEVKALDAAKIMGIAFDKRQVLNNLPTSIQGKTKDLNELQEEFERYLSAKEINIQTKKD